MVRARESVIVDLPITEVFDFVADGLNNAKWRSGVLSIRHVSGGGLGAVYEQTMKGPGGRIIRGDYQIVRFDPPILVTFDVIAGPARPTGTFHFRELSPTTTEVVFTIELEPTGLLRFMPAAVEKQVAAEAAAIHRLPAALGAGPAA